MGRCQCIWSVVMYSLKKTSCSNSRAPQESGQKAVFVLKQGLVTLLKQDKPQSCLSKLGAGENGDCIIATGRCPEFSLSPFSNTLLLVCCKDRWRFVTSEATRRPRYKRCETHWVGRELEQISWACGWWLVFLG